MVRSVVVLILLLFAGAPALGHPIPVPKPLPQGRVLLDLGSLRTHLFHEQESAAAESSAQAGGAGGSWAEAKSLTNLSVGPLHAQFGTDDNPRANLSIYQMQGMDQLGSSVWHNQQGRSAKLLFVWPTDK